ncbi:hypothetical protein Q1695_015749 [Nippostrongylus brasiliensis]|nr:hypothetical protein Q1695_015749 [Nippostrongylus brasiliensis]
MKSDVWNENAFKELLVPAVVDFTSNDCSDVERKTLLGATVDLAEAQFRPLRIIPHIVPTIAVVVRDDVVTVVSSELGPDWEELTTVLRHSYSNIEQYSQVCNFVVSSLADVYFQLDQLKCYVTDPLFYCDNVFWLLCDPFVKSVDDCPYEDFAYHSKATSKWVNGVMSNYDYILELNKAAGRVRGEVHNHPVFPWVCDFKETNGGWRDLSKTKYRLTKGDDQLGQNFRHLSHHIPEVLSDIGYMVYKARVESKTNLCKHVRSKWVPREYPASMVRMYEWSPDECIPEFYDDPSILVSCHPDMPDLELPSFVSSPEEFVKWHRDMLESDEVSRHLHEWIDLNFGEALSGNVAVDSLNVHMCFSEPKRHRLCTNGMVQLFHRPHPKRLRGSKGNALFEGGKADFELIEDFTVKTITQPSSGGSLLETYGAKIKAMKFKTDSEKMLLSFVRTLFRFKRHYLRFFPLEDFKNNNQRFIENSYDLPTSWVDLVEELVDGLGEVVQPSETPFYLIHALDVPLELSSFHDAISTYYSFHLLRKSIAVQGEEDRTQAVLLRELNALKSAMEMTVMGNSLVRLFERMIFDKESAVQTVHRLFIVACRSFDDQSFEQILKPLVELLSCESSVKLLDRRFLLPASIAYGTSKFLKEFLPTVIEAVASLQIDRSVVAKESVVWLSKRYGPVISARFITSNLLRVLGSCYSGMALIGSSQEPNAVFTMPLLGDECGARVEACLSEIAATYSVTFVTVQYLPFCVDLVEQATRRLTPPIEAGLLATFCIVRLSAKSMSDHQLMNYLEDYIVEKIIVRVLELVLNANSSFSDDRSRVIVASGVVSLLYNISMRIGLENTRMYSRKPFELLFETFGKLYEADEQLKITAKQPNSEEAVAFLPLWFVSSVIDRFASSWGVPLLSSFCSDPAFLVPFVSSQVANSPSSLIVTPLYQLNSFPSGNRLLSLSSPPSQSSLSSVGGVGLCESTSLSALWCARISAAVCAAEGKSSLRFDHLSLCSFNGHSSSVRRIVALSNENSFFSGSTDRTVKLWSIKPEFDTVEAQWTYNRHSRSILDIALLANNLIASTDGNLHVWDPFRGAIITQLDWDGDSTICGLSHVDRHSMAAISSLHSTVRLIDTRTGGWTSELKVSNIPGLTRAFSVRESGRKMVVALSNGTLVLLDARTGRLASLSHGNPTHATAVRWLSTSEFLVCDADEVGSVFSVSPRISPVRKLADTVVSAFVNEDKLTTLQGSSMIRVYSGAEVLLETKMKTDSQSGNPSSICYLPLNNAYLIGSNQGSIRLMC